MSNFDKYVLAFFPTYIRFGPIQRLECIRKIIKFWCTFGWKWWVISFRDYLGLSDACSYDVDDIIGQVDRFGFQNFCSPGPKGWDFPVDTEHHEQFCFSHAITKYFIDWLFSDLNMEYQRQTSWNKKVWQSQTILVANCSSCSIKKTYTHTWYFY